MLESRFQSNFIKKLRTRFEDCVILKNDSGYLQGFPDLTIFWHDRWAVLEVKADANADEQPNQRYYVELLDSMSFSAFVHPGNEEEVLDALQSAFRARRKTRIPQR